MARLWENALLRWGALLAWMGVIFFLSSQPTLPNLTPGIPHLEEVGGHLLTYAVLALLAQRALAASAVRGASGWALLTAAVFGLSDEFHQSLVPGRSPQVFDLAVDTIGALLALALLTWLSARAARK